MGYYKTCYHCGGAHRVKCSACHGKGSTYWGICRECAGIGIATCSICKGAGRIYQDDKETNVSTSNKGGGIGGLVIIGIVMAALFGGEDQKSAGKIYQLYYDNSCNSPVRLAINYEKPDFGWITAGWWEFSSKDHGYLMFNEKLLLLKNHKIYFYAETLDGNFVWNGDKYIKFKNITMPMRQKILPEKDNDLFLTLTCK